MNAHTAEGQDVGTTCQQRSAATMTLLRTLDGLCGRQRLAHDSHGFVHAGAAARGVGLNAWLQSAQSQCLPAAKTRFNKKARRTPAFSSCRAAMGA